MTEGDIRKVFELGSNVLAGTCPVCNGDGGYTAVEKANHILEHHNGVLLHVGQASDQDYEGNPFQYTVYVVGITN